MVRGRGASLWLRGRSRGAGAGGGRARQQRPGATQRYASGDLARAARLLGRPYTMRARVLRGRAARAHAGLRDRQLRLARRRTPLAGTVAVRVRGAALPVARRAAVPGWPAVASLGTRPTVNGIEPLLEVHLFDFERRSLRHRARGRVRRRACAMSCASRRWTLVEQMHRDAAAARAALG